MHTYLAETKNKWIKINAKHFNTCWDKYIMKLLINTYIYTDTHKQSRTHACRDKMLMEGQLIT